MFKYISKRFLYFIPTLIIIALLTFALSKMAPGDPVKLALGNKDQGGEAGQASEKLADEKAYMEMADKLGMNLPTFYLTLSTQSTPDTLYKFVKKPQIETLERFINQYGNWPEIEKYYKNITQIQFVNYTIQHDSTTYASSRIINENITSLFLKYQDDEIKKSFSDLKAATSVSTNFKDLSKVIVETESLYLNIKKTKTPFKNHIPTVHYYGINNQFHKWLFGNKKWFSDEAEYGKQSGFVRLDFGFSYLDKRPIWSKMKDALPWTLLLNFISLILAYAIAIPVGVWCAINKGAIKERIATFTLFLLYSLPSFWIATMLITFLTTEEYGMDLFPTYGLGEIDESMSALEVFIERGYHLLLPVFCLTYGSLAYLSRQMRGGVLTVLRQDYIRTARAKGLDEHTITWKHVFKNSLIPVITLLGSIFPAAIAGSFILEYIFSIPGMGKLTFEAIVARDYPMVFTVMMISAILTMFGNLVSDILYAFVDPRISFNK